MASIFSKIVAGEIPARRVAETSDFLAFLDIRPFTYGHVLCIPKREIDYYFDLPDDLLSGLTIFSKKVARAQVQCIDCKRVAQLVLGLEVPHAHVHLIPIKRESDLWQRPSPDLSEEELDDLQAKLKLAYEGLA